MSVLITSGGTTVPIDDARKITNMSSGRFGSELVKAALIDGNQVTHLHAADSTTPFSKRIDLFHNDIETIKECLDILKLKNLIGHRYNPVVFKTFEDYYARIKGLLLSQPHIVVLTAAVSDYGVVKTEGKIKSDLDSVTLQLEKLPKIINLIRGWEIQPSYLVGFKLLSKASKEQLIEAACESERKNHTDLIVANDLEDLRNNRHTLYLISGQKLIDTIKGENLAQKLWSAIQCGYNAKNKV